MDFVAGFLAAVFAELFFAAAGLRLAGAFRAALFGVALRAAALAGLFFARELAAEDVFFAAAFFGLDAAAFFDAFAAGRAAFLVAAFTLFLAGAGFRPLFEPALFAAADFLVDLELEPRAAAAFGFVPFAGEALRLEVLLFLEVAPDLLDLADGIRVSPPVQKNSSR